MLNVLTSACRSWSTFPYTINNRTSLPKFSYQHLYHSFSKSIPGIKKSLPYSLHGKNAFAIFKSQHKHFNRFTISPKTCYWSFICQHSSFAVCSTDSPLRFVDICITIAENNKSPHSISLLWWLLACEFLHLRGLIPSDIKWDVIVGMFFYREPEEAEKEKQAAKESVIAVVKQSGIPTPPQRMIGLQLKQMIGVNLQHLLSHQYQKLDCATEATWELDYFIETKKVVDWKECGAMLTKKMLIDWNIAIHLPVKKTTYNNSSNIDIKTSSSCTEWNFNHSTTLTSPVW